MATGAAKYIATGRSYASMTSSFVDLYQRYAMGRVSDKEPHTRAAPHHSLCSSLHYSYARSHFFFAFELIVLCVAYRLYTHQPGYFLLYTWPVWLVALAILLSPWAFNPKSFEGMMRRLGQGASHTRTAPLLSSRSFLYRPLRPHALPRVSRVARLRARRQQDVVAGVARRRPLRPATAVDGPAAAARRSLTHPQSNRLRRRHRRAPRRSVWPRVVPFAPGVCVRRPPARRPTNHTRAALMTRQAPSSDPRMGISFNRNLTS